MCGADTCVSLGAFMTLAVADMASIEPTTSQTVPIVIIGTDALLAALPATPVQLAHACLRAGFASALPASWGDEIIAAAVLRRLPQHGNHPLIQCSCPIVAHRLMTVGGDLRANLLSFVAPPVALARYVRRVSQPTRTRITYVGNCPGAVDEAIDIRMTPDALIAMLSERHISLEDQPRVFEAVIPPDRRRYRSQPGGIPTAEALWAQPSPRALVELANDDVVAELAQHLLTGKNILIDGSIRLGCVCSGGIAGVPGATARERIAALEPPRSNAPVVEEGAPIELDLEIPVASRSPLDVVAISGDPDRQRRPPPAPVSDAPASHRLSPVRGLIALPELRQIRTSNPGGPKPVLGTVPLSRDVDGKALPRAYVARRRSSPRGVPVVSAATEEQPARPRSSVSPAGVLTKASSPATAPDRPASQRNVTSTPFPWPVPRRLLVYGLLAAMLFVVAVSSIVAVVVARTLRPTPASRTQP